MDTNRVRPFGKADILLPEGQDIRKWSVVACDQHTSEPEYWERVDEYVGESPSTLRMMLPEHLYHSPRLGEYIEGTRKAIASYLENDVFRTVPNSYVYVERRLFSGKVRRGLIGQIDLEQYEYSDKTGALIRATEGIVAGKMPPRIKLRDGAPVELSHVLVLVDDPRETLIEPLAELKEEMELLYDFELMENGGHISGWRVGEKGSEGVEKAVDLLADPESFKRRYGYDDKPVMLFATGDGNHSLATAKACWDKMKIQLSEEERQSHPARFALVELINIHDKALEFEPINRVMFDCEPEELLTELMDYYPGSELGVGEGHNIGISYGERVDVLTIPKKYSALAIGALSAFFDHYLTRKKGLLDFVHGDHVVVRVSQREGAIGFVLPAIDKKTFFDSIICGGAFPRKTFSMGSAFDKRYYLECRSIER